MEVDMVIRIFLLVLLIIVCVLILRGAYKQRRETREMCSVITGIPEETLDKMVKQINKERKKQTKFFSSRE
ncbi:hypothetical protein A3D62_02870 [Candidatus Kaiserbacteria bacterium RIFCSPHIGHO2_02_FULL_49_11]|uniref:Uncharacterized protein n=1 Tax=Candidatus Kaiserbacteria bacterium RIFCSPHIGHO2_02_FULL_49_11 TaxID=1798489 RepID=A0A1F6D1A0_9BACT|nr:MAG: hypothetical protein A3D62_02870 [Candidatus Kaiserbacteria bacterium RIFCSPHIGHO2_02_FULL_49_11]